MMCKLFELFTVFALVVFMILSTMPIGVDCWLSSGQVCV